MNPKLILLVDDDRNFVATTRRILKGKGFRVAAAHNTTECFEQIKKEKPDLVVLDIMLETTGTGFEICRRLKQQKKTAAIPVIVLSAIDKVFPFKFATSAGDESWLPADEFLNKPIEAHILIRHIKRLVGP